MRIKALILNVPCALIENMEGNPLSVVIENNTFESGSSNQLATNPENSMDNNQHIYPFDKIMELNKETANLYERMLAIEKEKSALLEKLLNEKK